MKFDRLYYRGFDKALAYHFYNDNKLVFGRQYYINFNKLIKTKRRGIDQIVIKIQKKAIAACKEEDSQLDTWQTFFKSVESQEEQAAQQSEDILDGMDELIAQNHQQAQAKREEREQEEQILELADELTPEHASPPNKRRKLRHQASRTHV